MKVIVWDQPCGYRTEIIAEKINNTIKIKIKSECRDVNDFGKKLPILNLKDILTRIPDNIVYKLADLRHSTCIIPWFVLKLAEIELGLNVKKLFKYKFEDG